MTAAPWRSLSELEEELVSAEAATATLQATADEAHAKAFAAQLAANDAQLAANVAGRRARDIRFRIIRRRHEMGSGLTGMAAVSRAFLFLDGPANVLRAATTCSRWRELATADSVWRAKAVREGIVEKAGVFEVPLPAAAAAAPLPRWRVAHSETLGTGACPGCCGGCRYGCCWYGGCWWYCCWW